VHRVTIRHIYRFVSNHFEVRTGAAHIMSVTYLYFCIIRGWDSVSVQYGIKPGDETFEKLHYSVRTDIRSSSY